MTSLINTTLLSIKRVERTDGHGTQKIVHEVELKYGKRGKTAAIIYYPTAYGIHLLKPGDRIGDRRYRHADFPPVHKILSSGFPRFIVCVYRADLHDRK